MDRHKYMLISCAVLPRAHDCITLLMGSRTRYLEYFKAHPGTYFRSVGWADEKGWEFDCIPDDAGLIAKLMDGE